jgi:hypothetical protein
MKPLQAVTKPKRPCALKSTVVGSRRLIRYESFLQALGIEPVAGIDLPVTITIKKAQQLSGLSRATINRMLAAGNADVAA